MSAQRLRQPRGLSGGGRPGAVLGQSSTLRRTGCQVFNLAPFHGGVCGTARGPAPSPSRHPWQAVLQDAAQMLMEAGIINPRGVAEELLAHRLGQSRAEMLLEPVPLAEETRMRFLADVAGCAGGMPMQYVMGTASFYGREFEVGPGLFIPRPETEVLVKAALELLSHSLIHSFTRSRFVVDVGTGSGAIGITLALERPGFRVLATDRSKTALAFARRNAEALGAWVEFRQADLVEGVPPGSVDLLVANLPYLDASQAESWPAELHWEPRIAQCGGERGTALIRRLIRERLPCLVPGGWMMLEIGDGQAEEIIGSARSSDWRVERVVPDLTGRERVVVLQRAP